MTSNFTERYYCLSLCEHRQSNYIVVLISLPRLHHGNRLSYMRQLFSEIYLVYLWLGGALQLIKSLKSVCGHNKKNNWNGSFGRQELNYRINYARKKEIQEIAG